MTEINAGPCNLELERILEQSLECTSRLEDLLHDERTALELQDTGSLRALTTSKNLCVQCLESLDAERQELCVAAGYEGSEAGMKDMLSWCDTNATATPVWHQLLKISRVCEALNRTNGAIGRIRYEHVMSALAVLSNDTSGAALYGSEGQESAHFKPRALALV